MSGPTNSRPTPVLLAFRALLLTVGLLGLLAWWSTVFGAGDPEWYRRDWYKIWETGARFLAGERGLYTREFTNEPGQYFWLYPPYALLPASALALLPSDTAYAVLTALVLVLGIGSFVALARLPPGGGQDSLTMALVWFASPSFNSVVVTGQNSAFWLASLVGALWALDRRRPLLAALALACWGLKPNWVAIVVLWLVVSKRWRILGAVAVGGAVQVAVSLPLGLELWRDFLVSSEGYGVLVLEQYPVWKLISTHAALRALLPAALVSPVWILSELVLLGCAVAIWTRSSDVHRHLSVVALLVIAANVYANFYDSLVLALPAMVWWKRRHRYPALHNAAIGACIGSLWILLWATLYGAIQDPPSLVGLFVATWLVIEALVTRHLERPGSSPEDPEPATG